MTTVLSPSPWLHFTANDGTPAAIWLLFTYAAGTTTKLATFTDSTGSMPNTNPIVLDSQGNANVWLPPNVGYKYVLSPPNDTDPPSNPQKTVDSVVASQLITLYGGVDTGVVNAYVLNFVANYTGYADGEYIVWIPAHTNTGPSTINVNGFGVINITNGDGSALTPGQIVANAPTQILIKGGAALLVTAAVASGSFTVTCTSDGSIPALTVFYTRLGNSVTLASTGTSGTASATNFTFQTIPASLFPARNILNTARYTGATSNGTDCDCTIQVGTSGAITLGHYAAGSSSTSTWSASGTKTCPPFVITYLLN